MRVQTAPPDVVGERISMQDRVLKPNVPFSVQAAVRNNGTGSAPATTLRFYLSTDKNMTAGDIQLAAVPFAALHEHRTRAVLQQLQTWFVNSDRYIGFCLDAVVGETTTDNNCSAGIAVKGVANIAPIIMLLLED